MKNYLFSYQNCYKERLYIVASGKNRMEARDRIPFPCTYCRVWTGGPSWMIESWF